MKAPAALSYANDKTGDLENFVHTCTHVLLCSMNFPGVRSTRHANLRDSNSSKLSNLDADSLVPMTLLIARR